MLSTVARAKINLALHVVGQLDDGYHLIDSVVGFAAYGDQVSMRYAPSPIAKDSLAISGPFSSDLMAVEDNLTLRALSFLSLDRSAVRLFLEKNLPVASGIGGGSADAAAAIRLALHRWQIDIGDLDLTGIARGLGADVPMCLPSTPARVQGIGEKLSAVALPNFPIVLVNALVPVSTPEIFRTLAAKDNRPLSPHPDEKGLGDWLVWLNGQRNDLEAPACALVPEIATCLNVLQNQGAAVTRMSGSGATCFGLFETTEDARRAANAIKESHPGWWCVATELVSSPPEIEEE